MDDPIAIIRKIERWTSIDYLDVIKRLEQEGFFDVGHLVTANRLRKQGMVKMRHLDAKNYPRGFVAKMVILVMRLYRGLLRL